MLADALKNALDTGLKVHMESGCGGYHVRAEYDADRDSEAPGSAIELDDVEDDITLRVEFFPTHYGATVTMRDHHDTKAVGAVEKRILLTWARALVAALELDQEATVQRHHERTSKGPN